MDQICPLCQCDDVVPVETQIRHAPKKGVHVFECRCCGVQYLFPMVSEVELSDFYDGTYRKEYVADTYYSESEMNNFFLRNLPEAEQRVKRVMTFLRPIDDIVEIGCASGYFLYAVSGLVATACGTEWDTPNAHYAENRGFEVKKNIQDYGRKFDKIFLFHVLEHIREPVEFLRQLQPFLKENGMIFVEVPNREDVLLKTYQLGAFRDFYYQTAHIWYFNRDSLEFVCRQAGFKVSIEPLQRYDFSNHIHWLLRGVPGGQGVYRSIFSTDCDREYAASLAKSWQTDTLFSILKGG